MSRKDLPPFLSGKIDSCSHMCKEFMVDNTSDEQIQLRDAFMCYAKIIDGYTSHCICLIETLYYYGGSLSRENHVP